ncbi:30S ribosomal protein S2 [Candidatus Rariloculus sp.]|uniref:30S ribosomal protein S2 n=1 Tax=Candidatus Rariloculus sp. TaxID=3101265 RepID=UPI003D0C5AF1
MTDVTMRRMLEAGVHFGHQTRFWNPKMAPYIFGERNKIHIINLEETLPMYLEAVEFVRRLVADGGKVLFVGSKRAARQAIAEEAVRCGMPHVSQRWLGGMLTNFKTIRQSVKRLHELEELTDEGGSGEFTKKEMLELVRERDKLMRALGGIKAMESLPDAVFIVDVTHEEIAVREAKKLGIAVVAVVDTNCSPDGVDYTIPGNDDAMRAIRLYANGIADAVLDGKASLPEVPTGEGDFVELDEEGRPIAEPAKLKSRPSAKTMSRKKATVTMKVSAKSRLEASGAPASVEEAAPGEEAASIVEAAPSEERASGEEEAIKKPPSKSAAEPSPSGDATETKS